MDFSFLLYSAAAVVLAVLVSLLFYIILCIALWKHNKYNVKNGWYIVVSLIYLPALIIESVLFSSAFSIKANMVNPAHEYASGLAISLDSLADNTSSYISGVVDTPFKDEISRTVSSLFDSYNLDILSELKDRIPSVSQFLVDKGLENANHQEIVDYLFAEVDSTFDHYKYNRLKDLLLYTALFVALSILIGVRKAKKHR